MLPRLSPSPITSNVLANFNEPTSKTYVCHPIYKKTTSNATFRLSITNSSKYSENRLCLVSRLHVWSYPEIYSPEQKVKIRSFQTGGGGGHL